MSFAVGNWWEDQIRDSAMMLAVTIMVISGIN